MFLSPFIFEDKLVVSLNEGKNSFVIIFAVWDASGTTKLDLASNVISKSTVAFNLLILSLLNHS